MSDHPLDGAAASSGLRELVAAKDWSATPLGPMEGWSDALRTSVAICLGARIAAIVFWGPELVQIYNDGYAPLIGAKHPAALGQPSQACFPEIWHVIGPMLHGVMASGEATWEQDQQLLLDRAGFAEECYFTYTFSPIGSPIAGVFCVALESTSQVIGERRAALLRDLSVSLAGLPGAAEVFDVAVAILRRHPSDIVSGELRVLDDDGSTRNLPWPRDAAPASAGLDRLVALAAASGTLTVDDPGRPAVVVQPIGRITGAGPAGVLVLRVNPLVPFDSRFGDFIGQIAAAVGGAHAVAEAFEAAERRTRALEEVDRAKTAFLSNISHEFRTPLTLLLGPLAAIHDDGRLPADVRDRLTMAERNGRRVLRLVNNLLDLSRLEAGRVSATFQPTDLAALTVDLTSVFRAAADAAGIELIIDCAGLAEPVYVDREMWEQIVTNLCANALKFTADGTVTVRLSGDGGARLEVTDTGIGIAAADLPFIFDRFRRGEAPDATGAAGSGLGLALVRELVDLHGGRVSVDSCPGAGSTFVVVVPFGSAHLDPRRVASARVVAPRALSASPDDVMEAFGAVPAGAGTAGRWEGGPASGRSAETVWILDDNTDMREYLAGLLSPHWHVVLFPTAEQVLDALAGSQPDLILSDVMLPGLSGLDLLAEIRSRPAIADLPVILLSARAGEEATTEGLRAGADDYLVKPFTARELLGRVRSNLHLAGLRRDVGARAVRHATHLQALAGAATGIISAETLADIVAAVEEFGRDLGSVGSCTVTLANVTVPAGDGIRVPMGAGDGSAVGFIDLVVEPGVALHDEDRTLIEQLALVAGRRIAHLLRYRRERDISHTLQRSLLPQSLPQLPQIEIAARYRPAVASDDVGGDWYDALVLPDGRLMVTVGDVMGHDLAAAVTMGQIRLLLRAWAAASTGPAELCATVNRLLPIVGTPMLATAIIAFIDGTSGQATFVNAGHPLPILRTRTGVVHLDIPVSKPFGVMPGARYVESVTVLPPDSMLLLYTDGLIERRDEMPGVSRAGLVRRFAAVDIDDIELVIDSLLDDNASDTVDDIALLALRRRG